MQRLIEDARHLLREMPWIGVLLLVALVCSLRLHAAVISQADAQELRFIAKRGGKTQTHGGTCGAKRINHEAEAREVPGFKVSVGWMDYSVEVSVPEQCVRTMWEHAQIGFTQRIRPFVRDVA